MLMENIGGQVRVGLVAERFLYIEVWKTPFGWYGTSDGEEPIEVVLTSKDLKDLSEYLYKESLTGEKHE